MHGLTDNEAGTVCDSMDVADMFHKRHDHVVRSIKMIQQQCESSNLNLFSETIYVQEQNLQSYIKYEMGITGFSMLALNFRGEEAIKNKSTFINALSTSNKEVCRG